MGERTGSDAGQPRPVRVFISYAHEPDSGAHGHVVRDLWVFLRSQGIDAHLDLLADQQRQDWALWMADQVRDADHILVVASPAYRDRAQGRSGSQVGRRVQWEARLIRDAFYRDQDALNRFVPVVLPGQTVDGVPDFLAAATCTVYHVRDFTVSGAEPLVRLLTGQPALREPPLGQRPVLSSGEPTLSGARPTASIRQSPRPSGFFVGRSTELTRLSAALAAGRAAVAVVHGLGGVGKSTLVARFAEVNADRYGLVWWITADTPGALQAGLADLAMAVRPDSAALTPEQRVASAAQWLATRQDWLLVLDNMPGPAAADDLLARVHTGTVVITSRQATGWRGLTTLSLGVLPPEDAEELLTRTVRADWPDADTTAAARLCAELGWLPLAVEQAGAYLAQARVPPSAYLDLLARYPAEMFAAAGEGGNSHRTVARIWHITLDRVANTPLAGEALRQLAWYAPDEIPRRLVVGLGPEPDVLAALGRLHAYSMITLSDRHIAVHRLVQSVTRTPDASDPHRQPPAIAAARAAAVSAIAAELDGTTPTEPHTRVRYQAVLPHGRALLAHVAEGDDSAATVELLNQLGLYLLSHGDHAGALGYLERALRSGRRLAGGDDEVTLTVRANLASTHKALGDLESATSMGRATLAECRRLLGPDHQLSLAAQANLAHTYSLAGDLARALPLHQLTLTALERVLGPEHPQTLKSRSNVADNYASAGDSVTSIRLHESTLADRTRILGPEHPDTLLSRDSLAMVILSTGDVSRATPLLEAILAARERVLGPDHPDTLTSRRHLAQALQEAGSLDSAIALYENVLADLARVFGPVHPDSLACGGRLAGAYRSAGRVDAAIALYRKIVDDGERVFGRDSIHTLAVRSSLASAYELAGDVERAIAMHESVLAVAERVLGAGHPVIFTLRNNVANAYESAGDLARAIPLHEANLADRERVLGSDHPDVLSSRNNLTNAYLGAGHLERAKSMGEAVLADRQRILGAEHPDTLVSCLVLAQIHGVAGDLARAIPLAVYTLSARRRVLGPDHPDTLVSTHVLAILYARAGAFDKSVPLIERAMLGLERVMGARHRLATAARTEFEAIKAAADRPR